MQIRCKMFEQSKRGAEIKYIYIHIHTYIDSYIGRQIDGL